MSTVDSLFTQQALTEAEELLLREVYSKPVVIKHLKIVALEETKALLSLSSSNDDASVAKALARVQGRLEVLAALLSITAVQSTKE